MQAKPKKRKPVLLIVVASLAAGFVLYLEFFAPPIIDPPEFFSDGEVQVQFLVARSPFSRRVVSRLVTVDRLWRPTQYEYRGRDVRVFTPHDAAPALVGGTDCVLLADGDVHAGLPETFELLWNQRGYIRHLREMSVREGNRAREALRPFLSHVAEELGDLWLSRLCWRGPVGGGPGMD